MLRVDEQEGSRAWCRERERGGQKRRRLTEPKPGWAGGQRHTETDGWSRQRPLPFRRTSVWQVSVWLSRMGQGSQGHDGQDRTGQERTGQVRTGQVRTAGRSCMGIHSPSEQQENRLHRKHHTLPNKCVNYSLNLFNVSRICQVWIYSHELKATKSFTDLRRQL